MTTDARTRAGAVAALLPDAFAAHGLTAAARHVPGVGAVADVAVDGDTVRVVAPTPGTDDVVLVVHAQPSLLPAAPSGADAAGVARHVAAAVADLHARGALTG